MLVCPGVYTINHHLSASNNLFFSSGSRCQTYDIKAGGEYQVLNNSLVAYCFSPGEIKTSMQANMGITEELRETVRRPLLCHFFIVIYK